MRVTINIPKGLLKTVIIGTAQIQHKKMTGKDMEPSQFDLMKMDMEVKQADNGNVDFIFHKKGAVFGDKRIAFPWSR